MTIPLTPAPIIPTAPATPDSLNTIPPVVLPPISEPPVAVPAPVIPPIPEPVIPPVAAPVLPVIPAVVAPPVVVAPAEYDIEVADDSPLSDAELDGIAAHASKFGLSKEEAQALVLAQEGLYVKGKTAAETAYSQKMEQHRTALNAHPDFSGEKRATSWDSVSLAVNTFGTPKMIELLKTPEFGYDVELALFFKKLGDSMKPEGFVPGGTNAPANANIDAEDAKLRRNYPALFENEKK